MEQEKEEYRSILRIGRTDHGEYGVVKYKTFCQAGLRCHNGEQDSRGDEQKQLEGQVKSERKAQGVEQSTKEEAKLSSIGDQGSSLTTLGSARCEGMPSVVEAHIWRNG